MTHTDELSEPHETELRDLLERTMRDTAAPLEIGPRALREGRRLRTRRRVGIAAGAVAASAAVALTLPLALGGGSTEVVDPAGRPSISASDPVPETLPSERPDGWWNMPAVDMVSAVEAILPDGVTVTAPGTLTADTPEGGPGVGFINAFVTGATGPARLNVMLYPQATAQVFPPGGADADISCPGNLAPRAQCTELFAADGTTLVGRRSSTTVGGLTTLEVTLRRTGGTVHAETTNSLDAKPGSGSPVSAETPPLTLDQLEALVRNDTWVHPAT